MKEYDQIYFLKTVVGLKKSEHVPRQFSNAYFPMKELETMPRNMRKFKKTKLMRMFRLDEKRDDVFPDLQTAEQKKECTMDVYTLSVANKWIKEKTKAVV